MKDFRVTKYKESFVKEEISLHTFPPGLIGVLAGLTLGWGINWPMIKLAVSEVQPMHFPDPVPPLWYRWPADHCTPERLVCASAQRAMDPAGGHRALQHKSNNYSMPKGLIHVSLFPTKEI